MDEHEIQEETETTDLSLSLDLEHGAVINRKKRSKKRKPGFLVGVCVCLLGVGDRSRDEFYIGHFNMIEPPFVKRYQGLNVNLRVIYFKRIKLFSVMRRRGGKREK